MSTDNVVTNKSHPEVRLEWMREELRHAQAEADDWMVTIQRRLSEAAEEIGRYRERFAQYGRAEGTPMAHQEDVIGWVINSVTGLPPNFRLDLAPSRARGIALARHGVRALEAEVKSRETRT